MTPPVTNTSAAPCNTEHEGEVPSPFSGAGSSNKNSTGGTNNDGVLSKGELKKIAKKAEKAAQKAAKAQDAVMLPITNESKGASNSNTISAPATAVVDGTNEAAGSGGVAAVAVGSGNGTSSSAAAAATPVWTLVHPDATKGATIKAVWTAQAFGVELTVASATSSSTASAKHQQQSTSLILSLQHNSADGRSSGSSSQLGHCEKIKGTGGNSMALALLHDASSPNNKLPQKQQQPQQFFTDACWIDEWCEWERTVLRPSIKSHKTIGAATASALSYLEQALSPSSSTSSSHHHHHHHASSTPFHLVGHSLTVADICVLTTLADLFVVGGGGDGQHQSSVTIPPSVQLYWKTHESAYRAAITQAVQLQQKSQQSQEAAPSDNTAATIDMTEPSLLKVVDAVFRSVVQSVFGSDIQLPKNICKSCQNPKHGDYQFSAAMPIFAALSKTKSSSNKYASPQQVAAAIVEAFGVDHPVVADLQTQGPGFVLCRLQSSYLQYHVNVFLQTSQLAMPVQIKKQTCVVDFSSPNIAKEMHVGHLRSTIIGEAVCRILEAAGHTVHRINHLGDWGTQFGMLIQYLKEEYPSVVADNDDELPNITDLTTFYKNAKQRFDDNPDFKKTSQTNVVKLQSGNAECIKIWKMLCDVSRQEFQKVYTRLDVTCDEFGESYYNDKIAPVIAEFAAADKLKIEEGGAKCVFVGKYKVPLMLQKSDGGYGYDSTDMAALKYRLQELKADRIIVITDFSQGDHFQMIYAAGRDIGWVSREQRLEHIGFGTVQGEDGKRFKTRSGDTVRLVDLLDEAVNRMQVELQQRMDEGKANISADELHPVAEAIGYGAVKYYDLRRNPTSNYKFSYDQMLDTKGDTAVYLLYARVRLESIAAKASAEHNVVVEELLAAGEQIVISHSSERNLAFQLQQFTDVMEQTLDDLYPYHICEYVYKLATAASDFVTQCRVLGSLEMKSRILLCHATTMAMHQCFDLLGIRHVKRI